jgi:hypothetical protein
MVLSWLAAGVKGACWHRDSSIAMLSLCGSCGDGTEPANSKSRSELEIPMVSKQQNVQCCT